ncbi:hypothetical protein HB943_16360 [Listeria weihenstephanensis]|uniref:Uncharacterized protein n=1 Tax=Listeria weihenstephanensis TaxID=1006155 RepID=A0A841ZCE6_9LIST|nr:hypothetical protein [Listeria weihenstephanensis]MBC1502176.1 hypothetical protein [Listeria weihenstephanensis]
MQNGIFKVHGQDRIIEYYEVVLVEECFTYFQKGLVAVNKLAELESNTNISIFSCVSDKFHKQAKIIYQKKEKLEESIGIIDELEDKTSKIKSNMNELEGSVLIERIYQYLILKMEAEELMVKWIGELINLAAEQLSEFHDKVFRTDKFGSHVHKIITTQRNFNVIVPAIRPYIHYHIQSNHPDIKKDISSLSKKDSPYLFYRIVDYSLEIEQIYTRFEKYETLIYQSMDIINQGEQALQSKKQNKLMFYLAIVSTVTAIIAATATILAIV